MAREQMTRTKLDSIYWYKIDKTKKYAYRYKYYDNLGKRREKTKQGFDTIEQAERALIEVKAAILDGNNNFVENEHLTVNQLNDMYIQATKAQWKPTSERNHVFVMEKYILNKIGSYKIKKVNNLIIQHEIFDPLIADGFKKGSLQSVYQRLNAVFSFAVKNELLDRKRFSAPKLNRATESTKRTAFSIEEMENILSILKDKYKITHYTTVALLFLTGMRIGELRALTWNDVDFEMKIIRISKTRDKFSTRKPKTTNSFREFPINENIRKLLLEYKQWYDDLMVRYSFRNPDGYIFVNYAGTPIGDNFLKRIIDLICEKEKIPHFTPHYLRHTFVSLQLANNTPITVVAALIGDTPDTLMKVYAHSLVSDEKQASMLMDDIIDLDFYSEKNNEEIENE